MVEAHSLYLAALAVKLETAFLGHADGAYSNLVALGVKKFAVCILIHG